MGAGRVCFMCLLVGLVVLAGGLGMAMGSTGGDATAQQEIGADTVSLRFDVGADGTAAWRVTYRLELSDDNATAGFDDLRTDIQADPGIYVDRFASRMRQAMWTAENATGREMAIRNVSVAARTESLPQGDYGVVEYRLAWRGFAVVDGDRLRAGDAIDEFFLDAQTSLTVAWPEDYALVSHRPDATSVDTTSVTWQGRRDFGPGDPRVELTREPVPGVGGVPLLPTGAVVVLVIVVGAWFYQRRGGAPPPTEGGSERSAAASADEAPPDDLLSNEERVLRVLEAQGGRIKQQQVADELDWTDAKTSQVVSDLREAGDLESFRLGRENVLTLPDVSIQPEGDEPPKEDDG